MRKSVYLFILSLFLTGNLYSQSPYSQSPSIVPNIYNSTGDGVDVARFIKADSKGNMYVVGNTHLKGGTRDYLLLKYDLYGNFIFARTYNGPGNSTDTISSIFIDLHDDVYVTGSSTNTYNNFEITTIKYDKDGNILWIVRNEENFGAENSPFDVVVDNNKNVYVTGWVQQNGSYDCMLIKYNRVGELLWKKTMNGSANSNDEGYSLEFSPEQEYVYLGACMDEISGRQNFALFKFDLNGNQVWMKTYDRDGSPSDYVHDIAIDPKGCIYVTGTTIGDGTDSDITTLKYDKAGNVMWIQNYDGLGHGADWVNWIKLDKDNNVYLVGGVQGITYNPNLGYKARNDGYALKYNEEGIFQWIGTYDGPNHFHDCAQSLDIDEMGNVYITGRTCVNGWEYSDNIYTIKFNKSGAKVWTKIFDGAVHDADYGSGIVYNPVSRTVFSTGHSSRHVPGETKSAKYANYDVVLIKYIEESSFQDNQSNLTISELSNYPNPFNPVTNIQFSISKEDFIKLNVYDISGRLIKNLIDGYKTAGNHIITFDGSNLSSGVYFYTLQTSSNKITNRFILNK